MNNELISVIVIAYNVEKYIAKCLDSIINQTYTNLEIIVVDDASNDKTIDIVDKYKMKDARIKYIRHQNNKGQAIARNTGLDNATGEYISFIDSDDYVTEDYYELLYNNLKSTDSDISICNFQYVDEGEDNKPTHTTNKIKIYEGMEKFVPFFGDLITQFVVTWGKIYKSKLFINLRYIPHSSCEDANIFHKLFSKAKRVVYSPKEEYFYVKRKGSIINSKYNPKRLDLLDGEYDRIMFFENTLNNEKLCNCSKFYFWINLIKNFYYLEKDVADYEYYENRVIKRYDGVCEVLDAVKRLEGDKEEYNEDFKKFVDLNIPLEYVYRKTDVLSSNSNIELVKQDEYIMKISYDIAKRGDRVNVTRLFFEKNITNWEDKKGLLLTLKSSIKNKQLRISITDTNDAEWYKYIDLDSVYQKVQIPFEILEIDKALKINQRESIILERVKSIGFTIEYDSKNQCGYIDIKNIRAY